MAVRFVNLLFGLCFRFKIESNGDLIFVTLRKLLSNKFTFAT